MRMTALSLLPAILLLAALPACCGEIHDAARTGDIDTVTRLLDGGPLEVNSLDESGRTPLIIAAAAGQSDILSLLIERGALVNATNDRGATTLHFAASRGDSQIVRALIERGAVVNARAIGCATPLCWASSAGRVEAAEVLIARGANVNAECVDLWTPLYRAASRGSMELVRLLIDHGASVDMKCIEGRSPLHNAVESGNEDVVGLLLESGAPVDVRDNLGRSPLWVAVEMGYADISALLLAGGASIYANEFESGQTVLHQAAIYGYGDVAELLLASGADAEAENAKGRTPRDLAARYGHAKLARALFPRRRQEDAPSLRPERPSLLHYSLSDGEAAIWYLGGHGVAIRTRSHLLVLDYSEPGMPPDEPSLEGGRISAAQVESESIMAFVPGLRTGYPIRAIMQLHEAIPDMTYVLGFRTERGPDHVYVEPLTSVKVGRASVSSTAPNRYAHGQDFLITVDGVTIYKAFSWAYWDEQSSDAYREGVAYLAGTVPRCDIAIVPYSGGDEKHEAMVISDLREMSRRLRPKAVLCVGGTWQHTRDFAGEVRDDGIAETVLFGEYPGDALLYRAGGLEAVD